MLMSQNNADNTLQADGMKPSDYGVVAIPGPGRRQGHRQLRGRHQPLGVPEHQEQGRRAQAREVPDQPGGAGDPGQAVHRAAGGQGRHRSTSPTDKEEAKAFADVLATKAEPLPLIPAESAFETNVGNAVNGLLARRPRARPSPRATSRPRCRRPRTRWPRPAADAPIDDHDHHRQRGSPRASRRAARPAPAPAPLVGEGATPYLLVLPAVLLELLIHIVPMLVGVWMSFVKLTQFFIANWRLAPYAGLDNYRVALDFSGPLGRDLLHSFTITVALHRDRRRTGVGLRDVRGPGAAAQLPGPRGPAHAVPRAVRPAHLRGHHHVELHAPAGQRPAQPRPAEEPARPGPRDVLAGGQQRLPRPWRSSPSGAPGRSRSSC